MKNTTDSSLNTPIHSSKRQYSWSLVFIPTLEYAWNPTDISPQNINIMLLSHPE